MGEDPGRRQSWDLLLEPQQKAGTVCQKGLMGGSRCSASVEELVLAAAQPTVPCKSGFGIDSHQLCSSQGFP